MYNLYQIGSKEKRLGLGVRRKIEKAEKLSSFGVLRKKYLLVEGCEVPSKEPWSVLWSE